MLYLKPYKKYLESIESSVFITNILESLNVVYDDLLASISAEKKEIFEELRLSKDIFLDNLHDLEFLSENVDFINSLSSLGLKISEVKNSNDFSTFLIKPCRFMFIYDINSNELENPVYILIQIWIDNLNVWSDVSLYKISGNVNRFYDKLTSKTIEVIEGDQKWIYQTSNGNEWLLQNIEQENDIYQLEFRKEFFMNLLDERKPEVSII
jgi:hypothetical protein